MIEYDIYRIVGLLRWSDELTEMHRIMAIIWVFIASLSDAWQVNEPNQNEWMHHFVWRDLHLFKHQLQHHQRTGVKSQHMSLTFHEKSFESFFVVALELIESNGSTRLVCRLSSPLFRRCLSLAPVRSVRRIIYLMLIDLSCFSNGIARSMYHIHQPRST